MSKFIFLFCFDQVLSFSFLPYCSNIWILLDLMQTDPNWSNFLYDENSRTMNLIDFGAARDYPKHFVDDYLRMVTTS